MTESTLPAVPQYTLKSAARATPERAASKSRIGTLGTVLYAWTLINVTPVSAPAVLVTSGTAVVFPHDPVDGEHCPLFGPDAVSFVAPSHQRGPFCDEFEGEEFASPRPQPAVRHVPDTV